MAGSQLEIFNALQMTVDQALEWNPELEVALSDRPIRVRERWHPLRALVRGLSGRLLGTMSPKDERRDDMEIGTGTWTEGDAKFFPMTIVDEEGGFTFSELDGRAVLLFIDPTSLTLFAQYMEVTGTEWDGAVGEFSREGGCRAGTKIGSTAPARSGSWCRKGLRLLDTDKTPLGKGLLRLVVALR